MAASEQMEEPRQIHSTVGEVQAVGLLFISTTTKRFQLSGNVLP